MFTLSNLPGIPCVFIGTDLVQDFWPDACSQAIRQYLNNNAFPVGEMCQYIFNRPPTDCPLLIKRSVWQTSHSVKQNLTLASHRIDKLIHRSHNFTPSFVSSQLTPSASTRHPPVA